MKFAPDKTAKRFGQKLKRQRSQDQKQEPQAVENKRKITSQNQRLFLLLWTGEMISSIGSGMTSFGLSVYIFQKTGSANATAMIALAAFAPSLFCSLIAGWLADRHDRRLLMMLGDGLSALGIVYIWFCLRQGGASLIQICLGLFVSALFSALLEPAFRATITDLLTPEEYARASGLFSLAGAARYLISPMIAGWLLVHGGIGTILGFDALTFFPTVFCAGMIRKKGKKGMDRNFDAGSAPAFDVACDVGSEHVCGVDSDLACDADSSVGSNHVREAASGVGADFASDSSLRTSILKDLKEIRKPLQKNPGLAYLLGLLAGLTFFIGIVQVLCQPFILDQASSSTLAWVETVSGMGMLAGSLYLGVRGLHSHYIAVLCGSVFLAGLAMCGFGLSSGGFLAVMSFLFFVCFPFANTALDFLIRSHIEDRLQGRIWGVVLFISQLGYVLAYGLGGLLADCLARMLHCSVGQGSGFLIAISGLLCSLLAAALYQIPSIRVLDQKDPVRILDKKNPV